MISLNFARDIILISEKYNNMIDLAEEHWKMNGLVFDKVKYFAYG